MLNPVYRKAASSEQEDRDSSCKANESVLIEVMMEREDVEGARMLRLSFSPKGASFLSPLQADLSLSQC
eukprot:1145668-Pelagomonas_calceolata.AAC.4